MKRIVSILIAVLVLVLCLPVAGMAAGLTQFNGDTISGSDTYEDMVYVLEDTTVTGSPIFNNSFVICWKKTLTIAPGASVTINDTLVMEQNAKIVVSGTLKGDCSTLARPNGFASIEVSGGEIYMRFDSENHAGGFAEMIGQEAEIVKTNDCYYLVLANHTHDYSSGVCRCGMTAPTGSTLSEGNWWIIVAVAVVALGALAAVVVVTKRRKI